MKSPTLIALFIFSLTLTSFTQAEPSLDQKWQKLNQEPIPEWLIDAKFGIYAHWGIYSLGLNCSEWLGKRLYQPGFQEKTPKDKRALTNFENLVGGTFKDGKGYKDLVPHFTAENYDPALWADVVKKSGAKFAGFSLAHHDGFGLWDSDVYNWNAGKMGPKRDLYGDFVKELRKVDMKVIATSHMYRTYGWMLPPGKDQKRAKAENWDVMNPKFKEFYPSAATGVTKEKFYNDWSLKIREVIDKYQPDLFWFDGGGFQNDSIPADTLSYYFEQAKARKQEVHVLNKRPMTKTPPLYNFPDAFGIKDFEHGRDRPVAFNENFIDSLTITGGSWGYPSKGGGERSIGEKELIKNLIDSVSRGGALLLSLGPRADGTLPEATIDTLLKTGKWLEQNGEAIFPSRKWQYASDESIETERKKYIYEYKPGLTRWRFDLMKDNDIRYTIHKDGKAIYVLTIGKPSVKELQARRLGINSSIKIKDVVLLGSHEKITWTQKAGHLQISIPEKQPNDIALAFKVILQ